ncbi:CAMK family protein kinase [Tritrichomonas foetus]|uniref:CAMK family protein kinase n=1 Tax=Tritrichomonas foetus TaxID=1144522 RepID=A0A1J4K3Y6_9EUKA|nr:CAMK family protein kinase [Tritrichomonas foetus]|eukprot:OHT05552.1 CAMK family protein kinase [Tritrichomonas foetus]
MSSNSHFPNSSFSHIKSINSGTFSHVFQATEVTTQKIVAVKVIKQNCHQYDASLSIIKNEIDTFSSVDHPFIASYFGWFEDSSFLDQESTSKNDKKGENKGENITYKDGFKPNVYIVMEFVKGMTLLEFINQYYVMEEFDAQKVFIQLVSAIKYLHEVQKIVHRDIKLENIIVSNHLIVKLIDFGLSSNFDDINKSRCGSIPYMAPELILDHSGFTEAIDVWSLGVILFCMMSGNLPFTAENDEKLLSTIVYKDPDFSQIKSVPCRNLLKQILNKNPKKRITLNQIIDHEWLKNSPLISLVNMTYPKKEDASKATSKDEINGEILTQKIMEFTAKKIDFEKKANEIMHYEMFPVHRLSLPYAVPQMPQEDKPKNITLSSLRRSSHPIPKNLKNRNGSPVK